MAKKTKTPTKQKQAETTETTEPSFKDVYERLYEERVKDAKKQAFAAAWEEYSPTLKEAIQLGEDLEDEELTDLVGEMKLPLKQEVRAPAAKVVNRPKAEAGGGKERKQSKKGVTADPQLKVEVLKAIQAGAEKRRDIIKKMADDGVVKLDLDEKGTAQKVTDAITELAKENKIKNVGKEKNGALWRPV